MNEKVRLRKDEMIQLHQLLWKVKVSLEITGLEFDLRKYIDFDVYYWCPRIKFVDHCRAINLLAESLSSKVREVMLQET